MDLPNVAVCSGQLWTACDGCAVGTIGGALRREHKNAWQYVHGWNARVVRKRIPGGGGASYDERLNACANRKRLPGGR